MTASGNNILLTGVPRSGTTLICRLLNTLEHVVAVAEPPGAYDRGAGLDSVQYSWIDRYLETTRKGLLLHGGVESFHIDGHVPDNWLASSVSAGGRRTSLATLGQITIDKPLDADFLLAIKFPAPFTALLPLLVKRYRVFAVIRNPLSVLASWNSTQLPVARGRVPAGEGLDSALREALEALDDKMERQLYLLSWFFSRYRDYLVENRIVRYEDLVQDPSAAISRIVGYPCAIRESFEPKQPQSAYPGVDIGAMGRRLLQSEGSYWHFYSDEDVREMLES